MGHIYRPKLKSGGKCSVWWLKYFTNGRCVRESAGTKSEQQARRVLKDREGRAVSGQPVLPRADKIRLAELAEDLKNDYRAKRRRSFEKLEDVLAHVLAAFGNHHAQSVTAADVTAYVAKRQVDGAANATINRELAALKRMYRLAIKGEKLYRAPAVEMLPENNARTGFFEREQFEAVRDHLPAYAQPVVTFMYVTGWRIRSEVLSLRWSQVDFRANTVRLEAGTTKNGEGRTFVMTPELRLCLQAQRAATDAWERKTDREIPWVFHRDSAQMKGFRKAWKTACKAAGVPGRIPHDFRRTAVRNLQRAGVPQSVAMAMVGHKTVSIYRRYSIVDESMLRDAADKLDQFARREVATRPKPIQAAP
jgi:integrase